MAAVVMSEMVQCMGIAEHPRREWGVMGGMSRVSRGLRLEGACKGGPRRSSRRYK